MQASRQVRGCCPGMVRAALAGLRLPTTAVARRVPLAGASFKGLPVRSFSELEGRTLRGTGADPRGQEGKRWAAARRVHGGAFAGMERGMSTFFQSVLTFEESGSENGRPVSSQVCAPVEWKSIVFSNAKVPITQNTGKNGTSQSTGCLHHARIEPA